MKDHNQLFLAQLSQMFHSDLPQPDLIDWLPLLSSEPQRKRAIFLWNELSLLIQAEVDQNLTILTFDYAQDFASRSAAETQKHLLESHHQDTTWLIEEVQNPKNTRFKLTSTNRKAA